MSLQVTVDANPSSTTRTMRGLVALFLLIAVTSVVCGGSYLLTRQLWMDEVHSWLIVTDSDLPHAMLALSDGVDFNPPAWFLVTRSLSTLLGPASELQLRLMSLTWMLLALAGLYLLLSRHFSMLVCVVAVLLTASHPLLVHQSTEIRFYGFWCACAVWLAFILRCEPHQIVVRRTQCAVVFALSLITSTTHYFGVLSLSLLLLPVFVERKRYPARLKLGIAVACGGCAGLAVCLFFLPGQRAALSRPTWISPTTLLDSISFLQTMLPSKQVLLCLTGLAVSAAFSRSSPAGTRLFRLPERMALLSPCFWLAGMPLVIVLVAWCLQPALVTRYAIVGLLGLAPLFAIVLHQCSRGVQKCLLGLSLVGFGHTVSVCSNEWRNDDSQRDRLVSELQLCVGGAPIVFEDRIQWMSVVHRHPEFVSTCELASFDNRQLKIDSALRIVQRDVALRIEKWYPQYKTRSLDSLAAFQQFFVVPYSGRSIAELTYPDSHSAERISADIYRFVRPESGRSDESATMSYSEFAGNRPVRGRN